MARRNGSGEASSANSSVSLDCCCVLPFVRIARATSDRASVGARGLFATTAAASSDSSKRRSCTTRAAACCRLATVAGSWSGIGATSGLKPPTASHAKLPLLSPSTISNRARCPASERKSHSISTPESLRGGSVFFSTRPVAASTS